MADNIVCHFWYGLEISYNLLNLPSKMYSGGDYSDCYVYLANGTKILHEYKDRQQDECRDGSLVYEANDECCASFGGGRIVNTNNGANSKVHYFLIDHSGCKRVVAKGMPMSRIYLDHQITIPSAKLGNNCCTSSGSGKGPWYPCPTMPISGYGSTINNLHSRLRCAVLSDSRRSPSR